MQGWFHRVVLTRRWATFVVLGLSFFAFGAGSLNLFFVFRANFNLIVEHGWQALGDGAAEQLLELLITGYLSMAAYIVFKACEHRLVHWLGHNPHPEPSPTPSKDTHEDRDPAR